MKRLLLSSTLLLSVMVSSSGSFGGDFQKGMDAAQRGDFATALKEWKPLAEQGDDRVQYNLGMMYQEGRGVAQDYKTARPSWSMHHLFAAVIFFLFGTSLWADIIGKPNRECAAALP